MRRRHVASIPERAVRSLFASLGGLLHESAELVLPRVVRRSRLYEATAKNLLRLSIELVGGVEGSKAVEATPPRELALRKGAGNVVELGSIAAFGFSPLWLIAAASDLARGSRVYLEALVGELKSAGVLSAEVEVGSVDELLGVLERGAGRTARLIDIPPVELEELRRSIAELRDEREGLPSQAELATLFRALQVEAAREDRSLLEVSTGVGLAFLTSAGKVGREHLVVPYAEDWEPLRREGFADYASRVSRPYRDAVGGHFDLERETHTERLFERVRGRFSPSRSPRRSRRHLGRRGSPRR
jgi:hypothetical protein